MKTGEPFSLSAKPTTKKLTEGSQGALLSIKLFAQTEKNSPSKADVTATMPFGDAAVLVVFEESQKRSRE